MSNLYRLFTDIFHNLTWDSMSIPWKHWFHVKAWRSVFCFINWHGIPCQFILNHMQNWHGIHVNSWLHKIDMGSMSNIDMDSMSKCMRGNFGQLMCRVGPFVLSGWLWGPLWGFKVALGGHTLGWEVPLLPPRCSSVFPKWSKRVPLGGHCTPK